MSTTTVVCMLLSRPLDSCSGLKVMRGAAISDAKLGVLSGLNFHFDPAYDPRLMIVQDNFHTKVLNKLVERIIYM
jgi:hypothetical protein